MIDSGFGRIAVPVVLFVMVDALGFALCQQHPRAGPCGAPSRRRPVRRDDASVAKSS
ncbi:hypothetical protein ACIRP2_27960 [Streptomyces sp. NPDC101194]|uniref:hypothetical protein n=1 Tax=Streptomyces sp. NPDC101194 TaxID=3366127 RepID=UPI0037FDFE3A